MCCEKERDCKTLVKGVGGNFLKCVDIEKFQSIRWVDGMGDDDDDDAGGICSVYLSNL